MMKKKILFLSTRPLWPIASGHEALIYYMCKGLHELYGYDIYVFSFKGRNEVIGSDMPDFIKGVQYSDTPNPGASLKSILTRSVFGEKLPFQVSLYYSKDTNRKINDYVGSIKPHFLFTDMVRLVPYAEQIHTENVKKILYAEDDLAKRYKRLIEKSASGNLLGYYSKNTTGFINKLASNSFIKKTVLRAEIKRLERYEKKYEKLFSNIMFISPIETREFNERHKNRKAVTYTMGADIGFYDGGDVPQRKEKSLVFIGNMFSPPNADSVEMICREIMPKLDNDVVLYVIGKCPEEVKKRISGPRVRVLGFVEDVRQVAKASDVCVAPITYGTGIKTKIVEAMAMRLPVVTNSVGAEGLDVQSGRELYIAESTDEIVECINRLLNDSKLREEIGNCGYEYARTHHDWKIVYKVFDKMGFTKME